MNCEKWGNQFHTQTPGLVSTVPCWNSNNALQPARHLILAAEHSGSATDCHCVEAAVHHLFHDPKTGVLCQASVLHGSNEPKADLDRSGNNAKGH